VNSQPRVQPGQTLHLTESQYRFGVGPLTVRVDELIGELRLDDGRWMFVRGTAIWNGRDGEQRTIYVRLPQR
jgi:hypothetical protein